MLKNYFKIAFRNLVRNKSYSVINIIGLSIGIICCMLIFLFIRHEYSYDRFHSESDHIYRVLMSNQFGGTAVIPAVTNEVIANFPEVKNSVRLYRSSKVIQSESNEVIEEKNFFYTDPSFFNVFSFSLRQGNPNSALSEPNTIVLTQSASKKYFAQENPLGKTIILNNDKTFRVTGVMDDTPSNSHFEIDFLASFSSLGSQKGMDNQGFLYLLLNKSVEIATFQSKLNQLTEGSLEEISQRLGFAIRGMGFQLQPLTDIHLHPALDGNIKADGDLRYLYIFGAIGIFIIGIACINYMNLATAKSLNRAKEVGVRKTLGARRRQLTGQFLLESILLSTIAFLLALATAQVLLPSFEKFLGESIHFFDLITYPFILGSVLFILMLGLLSGSYPVAVLTRFLPTDALKGPINEQVG